MSSFTRAIRPALQGSRRAVLTQRLPVAATARSISRPVTASSLYA
ncbi:hypothetical protein MY8738_002679 [Beauveria namnaoensis]